ncbi:MAG TPA: PBP1A family penicillin-binding protein [Terriglobales bacterium]|nr:PBP1A family penicillin-binding protein [Terriglobales bacterium]
MKLLDADRLPVEVRTPEEMAARRRLVAWILYGVLVLLAAGAGSLAGLLFVYNTDLPQVDDLEHYRPISNTELYDDQGRVIGSFALQRRVVARYQDYPPVLREAVISIEDKNFEKHWGVNVWRILGAAWRDLISGGKVQGASTLTMQLSRNLFLSPERTYGRKLEEILLAIQIERRFTKAQIFTLYANQIFLGHGVYGFETGAEFYFGRHARDLTLPEAAMLAGLPKAPSAYSPINSPERALRRRNLVINSMLEDGKITAAEATAAKEQPIRLNLQTDPNSLAPYFVEEIRRYLEKKYGSDQVHQGGLRVFTTLDMDMQKAANQAVLDGLVAYEHRHGWKGRLENVLLEGQTLEAYHNPDWDETIVPGAYVHALVTEVAGGEAVVKFGRYFASLGPSEVAWTGRRVSQLLAPGDVAYLKVISLGPDNRARVTLEQDSGVQGALVAIDNASGAIKAMVGGRDFDTSKFNHATQAQRQVGSSFKPYVYTAAIDQGATPDDVVLDAPVTFNTPSGPYIPHNYDEKFEGNITLRRALANSRNIPALKTAEKVGIETVIGYAHRFGISEEIPDYLPIALGAADATVLEQTSAFSVFPEDGVRLLPRYITKVTGYDGRLLEENYPDVRDVISQRTARIMTSMLHEVVLHGTAVAASRMPYPLAGKTGTTNDFTDAWFVGFSPNLTCGVWVGFDEKKTLGNKETGARAALPIWMQFMSAALKGHDAGEFQPPPPLQPSAVVQKVDTPDSAPTADETH